MQTAASAVRGLMGTCGLRWLNDPLIEVNPRCGAAPVRSKHRRTAVVAARVMAGKIASAEQQDDQQKLSAIFSVKSGAAVNKFPGVDPLLGQKCIWKSWAWHYTILLQTGALPNNSTMKETQVVLLSI